MAIQHTLLLVALGVPQPVWAQPSSHAIDSGRVAVPGSSLFYEAVGHGSPLILLHAGSLDRRMWDLQFLALADSHRVIRYDARGHGRSGPVTGRFDPSQDLYALMAALRIPRATLVGCSLGGATAINFALAHPEHVARLVLVSSGLSGYRWTTESRDVPWRVAARAAALRGDTVGIARAWLQSDYFAVARTNPTLATRLDTLLSDNVESWKSMLHNGSQDTVLAGPALGRLHQIRVPALVVVGRSDIPDIQRIADTLRAHMPVTEFAVIEGTDHLPNMERPSEFLRILRGFLGSFH